MNWSANYRYDTVNNNSFNHIPITLFIIIEALAGIVGNSVVVYIYNHKYRKSNVKYFVMCLALIDLLSCITVLPAEVHSYFVWFNYEYEWICKAKSFFHMFTVWSSSLSLLMLAIDRSRKICSPLKSQIHTSLALKMCIASVMFSLVISTPVIKVSGLYTIKFSENNQSFAVTACDGMVKNDRSYAYVYFLCAFIIPVGLIILVTCFLNVAIARRIFIKSSITEHLHRASSDCSSLSKLSVRRHSDFIAQVQKHYLRRYSAEQDIYLENSTYRRSKIDLKAFSVRLWDEKKPAPESIQIASFDKIEEKEQYMNTFNETEIPLSESLDGFSKSSFKWSATTRKTMIRNSFSTFGSSFSWETLRRQRQLLTNSLLKIRRGTFPSISRKSLDLLSVGQIHNSAIRCKTKIILFLISIFTVTMIIHLVLLTITVSDRTVIWNMTLPRKLVFIFFMRLYFINCVINPILYGIMDPRFRTGLRHVINLKRRSSSRISKIWHTNNLFHNDTRL